jgi:hypothetical protein
MADEQDDIGDTPDVPGAAADEKKVRPRRFRGQKVVKSVLIPVFDDPPPPPPPASAGR